jgi:hypothetical protein
VYDADRGFTYSVQPRRDARRVAWPPPAHAWQQFTHWEASRSAAEKNSTGGFDHRRLLRDIQIRPNDENGEETEGRRHALRIVMAEHVRPGVNPEDAFMMTLRDQITSAEHNSLRDPQTLIETVTAQQRILHPKRDHLSSMPAEVLDLILSYAIHVHLDVVAFVDPPPAQRLRTTRYNDAEREALADVRKSIWPFMVALPPFHVSQLLRARTVSTIQRITRGMSALHVANFLSAVDGTATVRMNPEEGLDDAETEALGAGILLDTGLPLREMHIPTTYMVSNMTVRAVWDYRNRKLLSPLKRLIGVESAFFQLKHIVIQCQIVNHAALSTEEFDAFDVKAWDDLAESIYGPSGAYVQISEEVSRALATAWWASLARRTGIWPGQCMRPTCTPHGDKPCRARPPFMAHRVPVFDIDLIPDMSM